MKRFLRILSTVFFCLFLYSGVLWRLWWRSVRTFHALLPVNEDDLTKTKFEYPLPNRRKEWAFIVLGAVLWISLWQPWGWGVRW